MHSILDKLDRFGVSSLGHSHAKLVDHLIGTYEITKSWDCPQYLCLAALCHSIYGTESFAKSPATLENRNYMREAIGEEAEQLAYLFGSHVKESLWKNLAGGHSFKITDRFQDQDVEISERNFRDLVTITLANWLEQRPRQESEYLNLRKEEFMRSRTFLPEKAYINFIQAYGL